MFMSSRKKISLIVQKLYMSGKVSRVFRFTPKEGGEALFLKIDNSPTLKCPNFFVFGPIYNSLKVGIKHGRNYSSADIWDLRPFHRPEISVGRNFCVFSWMTCLPPPFIFSKNENFQKKIFVLFNVSTHVFGMATNFLNHVLLLLLLGEKVDSLL